MRQEAQFLLDRLDEYDLKDEDHVRDWHGHVTPAIARLRSALAKSNPVQRSTEPEVPTNDATYLRGWKEGIERAAELLDEEGSGSAADKIRTLLGP